MLELVSVEESEQEELVRGGGVDMALVRLPIASDSLHCIPLYEEQPVVVVSTDHVVSVLASAEEVTTTDLADEQLLLPERSGWTPSTVQLPWPAMTYADAVEAVAAGSGILVLPMSVARLHHRRDVTYRRVRDLSATRIGLAWLTEHDTPDVQTFIGVVRGRTPRSSRS